MSRGFRRDYQGGPYDWLWLVLGFLAAAAVLGVAFEVLK